MWCIVEIALYPCILVTCVHVPLATSHSFENTDVCFMIVTYYRRFTLFNKMSSNCFLLLFDYKNYAQFVFSMHLLFMFVFST